MLSENIEKVLCGSSAIREMFEEGNRLKKKYGPENVFDFSLGNPSIPAPKEINEAIKKEVDCEDSISLHGYMANVGYEDVREAVANNLNERFDTDFNAKNIIMTVGAAGGMNVLLKTIINPGDEVIVFSPFFGEYKHYVSNFGGKLIVLPPNPPTFMIDIKALKAAVSKNTKAVIINNPNNPTGAVYSKEVIKELADCLREKQKELGTDIVLISDEPYRELVYDGKDIPFLTKYYENTVIVYSFSKSLSLPGERIGYLVIPDSLTESDKVIAAAGVATRVLGFVNAPSLMQKVIKDNLNTKINVASYDNNRKLLYDGLTEAGFECVYPDGAFYIFMKSPVGDEKEFIEAGKKYNILMVPGSAFGCPGYVRLAYCVSEQEIKNSLPYFKKLAEDFNL